MDIYNHILQSNMNVYEVITLILYIIKFCVIEFRGFFF